MPKAFDTWKVLPHGPIEELAENLWWVSGSLPGMSLRRTMTVARLSDRRLVIHNAIALEDDAMRRLEAWGAPSLLVVPNGAHRLDAKVFQQRYPDLRVLAPRGSKAGVEQVLPVDATTDDVDVGDASVRFEPLAGVGETEAVMIVRSEDGLTVVLTDAVFNMDRKRDPLGFLITTLLGSAPGPRVSRLAKLVFIEDKRALRRDLERLAELPGLTRLIVAHEKVAHGADAAEALRRAATYL